ncbi:hypothetical protein [Psychrobacter sp. I-STPA10]|uniref:hypothetical protein n=1 Tax=Psychrobacter sp. I-STPA10 TaxID=2585769 RepID=UPI001E4859B8|nr:hypothetical protein [Psychrobacter sp. I-STPA10]
MIIGHIITNYAGDGYIAGSGAGIVTVAGKSASREVILLDNNYNLLARQASLKNGHYMFIGLDPNKQYLVICRDLPPNGIDQRYEPFCWDYVTPATDLTVAEQQELWQSWQSE